MFPYKDNGHIFSLIYSGTDGQGWSDLDSATEDCRQFLPNDATFKRTVETSMATQRVYISPSLAQIFPAKVFTDENVDITTPGTISIAYHHDAGNATLIVDCSLQVGLETN